LKFLKEHGKVIIYVIIWYLCFHTTSKCKYLIENVVDTIIGISILSNTLQSIRTPIIIEINISNLPIFFIFHCFILYINNEKIIIILILLSTNIYGQLRDRVYKKTDIFEVIFWKVWTTTYIKI
jgi:hypothetical protein